MALTDTDTTMLVAPTGANNGGFGFGDGNGWWIILLFILLGGWGNFGGYGNGGVAPEIQTGFNQQAVVGGLTDIQQTLCSGFAQIEANANARQIADMQTAFNAQTAVTQGMNTLSMGLQNCCCENRASVADLKYTVATENCADRAALNEGVRDIIASNTAQTQAILDKLCALELDNYKRENDALRTQLNMAALSASQAEQTAQIKDGQTASVNALVNELRSCPIPAQPVYGSQPIFTCNNSGFGGCGCGM